MIGPAFDVRAAVTNCDPKRMGPIVRTRTWGGLARERLVFALDGPRATESPLADPRGQEADPVTVSLTRGRGCITTARGPTPGVATWEVPVARDFTLLGLPRLTLAYHTTAPDLELNSRLWDVAPNGTQTLVTRGAYRAVSPSPGGDVADYELFGNALAPARGPPRAARGHAGRRRLPAARRRPVGRDDRQRPPRAARPPRVEADHYSQRSVRGASRMRMTRAGTPATTALAGTSLVTTAFVPMIGVVADRHAAQDARAVADPARCCRRCTSRL